MMANIFGAHDEALKDFDHGIRRWPQSTVFFDLRAKTLFNLGRYDEAAEAFVQTVKVFPGDPPPVLWLHLSRMHAGQPDAEEFAANTAKLSLSGWMKAIFDYYQGRVDYDSAMLANRSSGNPDAECMTTLFIGEHMLAKKDPMAVMYLGGAAGNCSPNTAPTSRMAAWAEVKKLNPGSRKGWSR
jgi:lipoprotein NlpI